MRRAGARVPSVVAEGWQDKGAGLQDAVRYPAETMQDRAAPPYLLALVALVLVSLACQALASAQPGATQAPQQIETQASVPSKAL